MKILPMSYTSAFLDPPEGSSTRQSLVRTMLMPQDLSSPGCSVGPASFITRTDILLLRRGYAGPRVSFVVPVGH